MALSEDRLREYLTETARHLNEMSADSEGGAAERYRGAALFADRVIKELPRFRMLSGPSPHNVRRTDPESAQAAASNTFGRSKNRERVYLALLDLGAGTAEEIAARAIEMFPGTYPPYSLARRVTDLQERGLIHKTGERRTTLAGGTADVWAPVPESISQT